MMISFIPVNQQWKWSKNYFYYYRNIPTKIININIEHCNNVRHLSLLEKGFNPSLLSREAALCSAERYIWVRETTFFRLSDSTFSCDVMRGCCQRKKQKSCLLPIMPASYWRLQNSLCLLNNRRQIRMSIFQPTMCCKCRYPPNSPTFLFCKVLTPRSIPEMKGQMGSAGIFPPQTNPLKIRGMSHVRVCRRINGSSNKQLQEYLERIPSAAEMKKSKKSKVTSQQSTAVFYLDYSKLSRQKSYSIWLVLNFLLL